MTRLGDVVGKAAPIVGGILNAVLPGSGLIVSGLMSLFGVSTETDLKNAIATDPLAAEKLKEFEITHQYDLEQINAADRSSARGRESAIVASTGKRDWVMEFIAVVMVLGFFGMCFIISFFPLAKTDTNLMYLVIGQFSTGFITVLAYYFGATNQKQASYRDINLPHPAQTR